MNARNVSEHHVKIVKAEYLDTPQNVVNDKPLNERCLLDGSTAVRVRLFIEGTLEDRKWFLDYLENKKLQIAKSTRLGADQGMDFLLIFPTPGETIHEIPLVNKNAPHGINRLLPNN